MGEGKNGPIFAMELNYNLQKKFKFSTPILIIYTIWNLDSHDSKLRIC